MRKNYTIAFIVIGLISVLLIAIVLPGNGIANRFASKPSPETTVSNADITPQLEEKVLQIIRDNPEVILESVQAYREKQQQEQEKARNSFLQEMKSNPRQVIGSSPTTGAKNAKVVLIEFSDFQCPFCGRMHPTLKEFMAKHQDEVTWVYKHRPLASIHPQAIPAASAAWAAHQQGKFWEYHSALFEQQDKLGEELYLDIAKNLNLDVKKFNRDRQRATPEINKDIALAQRLGINSTPFFVMNGETLNGLVTLSDLEKTLARVSADSR